MLDSAKCIPSKDLLLVIEMIQKKIEEEEAEEQILLVSLCFHLGFLLLSSHGLCVSPSYELYKPIYDSSRARF